MNTDATSVSRDLLAPAVSTVEPLKLVSGQKLTLLDVNSMAFGLRREITLKSVCEPTFVPDYVNAPRGKWRVGTFTEKGKRTEFHLDLSQYAILLDGWNHPVLLESEAPAKVSGGITIRTMSMNACLNLVGSDSTVSHTKVREIINAALFCPETARLGVVFDGKVLFPDAAGSHAVITRMKSENKVWAVAA